MPRPSGTRATPRILVWSALNMGASQGQIFRRVVLPLAKPGLLVVNTGLPSFLVTLALNFIALRVVKRFREAYE